MADGFRVEPAVLTAAAGRISELAGDGGTWGGTADPLTEAAGDMAGSTTAAQAGELAGEVAVIMADLTAVLDAMARTAEQSSSNYLTADGYGADLFRQVAGGLPEGGWSGGSLAIGGGDW